MNNSLKLTALTLCLSLSACSSEGNADNAVKAEKPVQVAPTKNSTPPPTELSKGSKVMSKWYTGTLTFIEIEGGFFGFVTEAGEKYLPLNMPKEYLKNGSKLKIYGHHDKDIMTIQMWGKPFKVLDVELISEGKNPHPNH